MTIPHIHDYEDSPLPLGSFEAAFRSNPRFVRKVALATDADLQSKHLSSILFGDIKVPNMEQDFILLLGYSILYQEYYLTRFNHQREHDSLGVIDMADPSLGHLHQSSVFLGVGSMREP